MLPGFAFLRARPLCANPELSLRPPSPAFRMPGGGVATLQAGYPSPPSIPCSRPRDDRLPSLFVLKAGAKADCLSLAIHLGDGGSFPLCSVTHKAGAKADSASLAIHLGDGDAARCMLEICPCAARISDFLDSRPHPAKPVLKPTDRRHSPQPVFQCRQRIACK